MYRRSPPALTGAPLILFVLLIMGILTYGFAGQPSATSIEVPESMQIGQSGYIAVNLANHWWGRTISILRVTISIGGGSEIDLLGSPFQVPANSQRALIFPFTVPSVTPMGKQPYVVQVYFTQTEFLFFGEQFISVTFNGTVMITPW